MFFDTHNCHLIHNAVSLIRLSLYLVNTLTRRNGLPTSRGRQVLLAAVLLFFIFSTMFCISSWLVCSEYILYAGDKSVSRHLQLQVGVKIHQMVSSVATISGNIVVSCIWQ